MTQKQTLSEQEHPGLWFYNLLMSDIEPDLCSNNIDQLDELYTSETPIQERARLERYEKAFENFEKVISIMKDVRVKDAQIEKKKMHKKLQKQESKEHTEEMSGAEEKLDTFDEL